MVYKKGGLFWNGGKTVAMWKPFSPLLSINKEGFLLRLALISGQTHFGLLLRVKVSQVGCLGGSKNVAST